MCKVSHCINTYNTSLCCENIEDLYKWEILYEGDKIVLGDSHSPRGKEE